MFKLYLIIFILPLSCLSQQKKDLSLDYYNIANEKNSAEDYAEAIKYYKRSLNLNPKLNAAKFNLAETYTKNKDYAEARKILKELQKRDPENIKIISILAFSYFGEENYSESLKQYRRALEINPYDERNLYNISLVAQKQELYEESLGYLLELNSLNQESIDRDIQWRTALALFKTGNTADGMLYYDDYIAQKDYSELALEAFYRHFLANKDYDVLTEFFTTIEENVSLNKQQLFWQAQLSYTTKNFVRGNRQLALALRAGFNDEKQLRELRLSIPLSFRQSITKIIKNEQETTKNEPLK